MRSFFTASMLLMITSGVHYSFASNLIECSPFLPPGYGENPAPKAVSNPPLVKKAKYVITLGGLASVDGQVIACLSAKGDDRGTWYAVGDQFLGMRVEHIDLDRQQVKLSDGTNSEIVNLRAVNPQLPVITRSAVKKQRTVHTHFSSLSPETQQYYRENPQMIGELYRQSVNVPQELVERYKQVRSNGYSSGASSVTSQSVNNTATSSNTGTSALSNSSTDRKRYPLPSRTVSHTAEEKAALRAFAQGSRDYLP